MELQSLGLTFLFTFLAYRASIVIYRLHFHPLANFPGPRLAAVSTLWRAYHQFWRDGKLLHTTKELHKRYGPVIRTSPNELDFCDPGAFFDVYNTTFNGIKDPDFYNHLRVESDTMLLVDGDAAEHKARFRPVATLFSARQYETTHQANIVEKVERFSNLVSLSAESRRVCSLAAGYRSLTIGIMYDFIFTEVPHRFKSLRGPDFDDPLTVASADALNWTSWLIRNFPVFSAVVMKLPPAMVSLVTRSFEGANRMFEILSEVVEHEKNAKGHKNPDCVAQRLLNEHVHHKSAVASATPDSVVRSEAIGFMLAGTVDPPNILALSTFMVARDPALQEGLYRELKSSWPDMQGPTPLYKVLRGLPLLRGIVQEGIRLTHGVATGPSRLVGKGGARVAGYDVPAKAVVAAPSYFVHMDPKVFPNPEKFDPSRWADDDRPNLLVAFSRGRRMCPAEQYSLMMLYTALAAVFRRFRVEPYKTTIKDFEWNQYISIMFSGRPLRAIIEKRLD